jgi:hypothetical protein
VASSRASLNRGSPSAPSLSPSSADDCQERIGHHCTEPFALSSYAPSNSAL